MACSVVCCKIHPSLIPACLSILLALGIFSPRKDCKGRLHHERTKTPKKDQKAEIRNYAFFRNFAREMWAGAKRLEEDVKKRVFF
jgi:hypothetical protein